MGTVHQEDAQVAHVAQQDQFKILQPGVENTVGTLIAANVLFLTKVEVTHMQLTITQTRLLMWDFGKSTMSIGPDAMEEKLPVHPKKVSSVRLKSIRGAETVGDLGALTVLVDVEKYQVMVSLN